MFDNTLLKEKENRILDFLYYWDRPIRAGDIAEEMSIPHSTLNSVLTRLTKENLILWEKYGPVALTQEGKDIAAHLSNHHFIIEYYLKQTLDLTEEQAHTQALHLAGRVDCVLVNAICEKFGLSKSQIQTRLCEQREYRFE